MKILDRSLSQSFAEEVERRGAKYQPKQNSMEEKEGEGEEKEGEEKSDESSSKHTEDEVSNTVERLLADTPRVNDILSRLKQAHQFLHISKP